MNDPHVESLQYHIETDGSCSYESPPPVEYEKDGFRARLEEGVLTVTMKEHHASAASARKAVAEFLRSWEIQAALSVGRGCLRFEHDSAKVVDRHPSPGTNTLVLEPLVCKVSVGAVTLHIGRSSYPEPPKDFVASPLVETMWHRFEMFLDGREPLASMAYFCLSTIQADAGGRNKAAAKYHVDRGVLDKLGQLTSEVGDSSTARKIDSSSTLRPHTPQETEWMKCAVQTIIRRVGEVEASPTASRPRLTMSDLPRL